MNEALEFYKKHGLEECKRAYALSVNAGCEDMQMLTLITLNLIYREHDSVSIAKKIYQSSRC